MVQQAMQRLFVAYNRVTSTDDRLEQFKTAIRRDATELALTVQRTEHEVRQHRHDITQMHESMEDAQEKLKSLEERFRQVAEHEHHVNQTIDKNTHSQCASVCALIQEQGDIRKLVQELANRLDQSQGTSGATQSEVSTNVLLELGDLKSKVLHLIEQNTALDGDVSYLKKLSGQVEMIESQVIKWRFRLPELTEDDSEEWIVLAVEVREELDELKEVVLKKFRGILTRIGTLEESVHTLEHDREDSWEAISHKVSTLVEESVGTLTERLTELEHTVQSQRTTPITDDDDILNMETWSTMEQAIWSEMGKLREHAQEVPNLYTLCEQLHENQKSQEKRLLGLRNFARQVEQYLERMSRGASRGAAAPKDSRDSPMMERSSPSVSLAYVPGASVCYPTITLQPRWRASHWRPRREGKAMARVNVGSLNLGWKDGSSSAFISFEELVRGVTNVGMSIR